VTGRSYVPRETDSAASVEQHAANQEIVGDAVKLLRAVCQGLTDLVRHLSRPVRHALPRVGLGASAQDEGGGQQQDGERSTDAASHDQPELPPER
jgi:hypothetical protein